MKGNVINRLMERNDTTPEVGKYCKYLAGVDRCSYKVVDISKDGVVTLQYLQAYADTSKELGMGHQNWLFKELDQTMTIKFVYGKWKRCTWSVLDGKKKYYYSSNFPCIFVNEPEYYYCWEF